MFVIWHQQDWNASHPEYPTGHIDHNMPPLPPNHYCTYDISQVVSWSDCRLMVLRTNGVPLVVDLAPGEIYTVGEIRQHAYDHPVDGFSHARSERLSNPVSNGQLHQRPQFRLPVIPPPRQVDSIKTPGSTWSAPAQPEAPVVHGGTARSPMVGSSPGDPIRELALTELCVRQDGPPPPSGYVFGPPCSN